MKLGERYRINSAFFAGAECTVVGGYGYGQLPIVLLDKPIRGTDPLHLAYVIDTRTIGFCTKLIEAAEVEA